MKFKINKLRSLKSIAIFLMVFIAVLYVRDVSGFEIEAGYFKQLNDSENFGPSDGIKVRAGGANVYAWLSGEHARWSLADQPFGYLDIAGAGIGFRKKLDGLSLFVEAGWYLPLNSPNRKLYPVSGDLGDRVDIWLNQEYADTLGARHFDYYTVKISGNYGGSAGAAYRYELSRRLSVNAEASYRLLSMPLWADGKMNDSDIAWCRYEDQSLSGVAINIGIHWEF